jgi:hypothetical protein
LAQHWVRLQPEPERKLHAGVSHFHGAGLFLDTGFDAV